MNAVQPQPLPAPRSGAQAASTNHSLSGSGLSALTPMDGLSAPPEAVAEAGASRWTEVTLANCAPRFILSLRFGEPIQIVRRDERLRTAAFPPGAVFCRGLARSRGRGKIWRQVLVMQAGTAPDVLQRVPGVRPGARLLLRAEGEAAVRQVITRFAGIEARGIALTEVAPPYWCVLNNRLAAGKALPDYTDERHAAWLTGRRIA